MNNNTARIEKIAEILSIEDVSKETGLEESLIRFYESEYGNQLPDKVWRGDALFFKGEAVPVFKRLHARFGPGRKLSGLTEKEQEQKFARVIAVTSGKGGVGKTNLALNLAIELQSMDKLSILLDADMGMANVHLLAGVKPGRDIMAVVRGEADLSDIIIEGPGGIGIVPGGGGLVALADSSHRERMLIIEALSRLEQEAEIVLVDTGAGLGGAVRDFLVSADDMLFVLTPEITSLADAYGLLKAVCHQQDSQDGAVFSVVNMVRSQSEAFGVAQRFADCAMRFLGRKVTNLGYIMKDATVGVATNHRTPYSIFRPQAKVSINTRNVAKALLKMERPEIRLSSSFGRYLKRVDGRPS